MEHVENFLDLAEELESMYPFLYVEIARTRKTDWMAWLCTHPQEDNPERQVLAQGQGSTATEACEDALADFNKRTGY